MAYRELEAAGALSEFVAGFHGDCGQTAELAALHCVFPDKYPLDAAQLSTIVHRDIAHGWAGPSGAEPINSIASDLDALGIKYTMYPFGTPFDWQGLLRANMGLFPVILEYAHAGVLPGDESGVFFHFNCCIGGTPEADAGRFADGDNAAAASGQLVTYTFAQLAAAQPCAAIVVHMQSTGAPLVPSTPAISTKGLGPGFANYVTTHSVTSPDVSGGEHVYDATTRESFASFADGLILYYSPKTGVKDDLGGYVAAALWNELAGARAAVASLTATVGSLNAQLAVAKASASAPAPVTAPSLADASPEELIQAFIRSVAKTLTAAQDTQIVQAASGALPAKK